MAEKKKNGCLSCLVTLFLLGLIATMLLGGIGVVAYMNRETIADKFDITIPTVEEAQKEFEKALKNAESGKGFSGNAGKMQQVDAAKLAEELKRDDMLVLVSYSADWFEPCRQMRPELERLAWKYGDKVSVVDVQVDEEQALVKKQKIEIIPHYRLMYMGKELASAEGHVSFSVLESMVNQFESVLEGSKSRALVMPDGGVIEPGGRKWVPEGFSKTMTTGESRKDAKK
ncbi:MAG: thioredoxin family protein [Verrucomicrobiales bacterium]|nr:thioredoxin family protein [Verrucomicrobiales bacterium]